MLPSIIISLTLLKSHIAYKMTNNESQKDIAKDLHVSDWTIRRVI